MSLSSQKVQGQFRAQVVDRNGQIFRDYGWQSNLILNQGMDSPASRLWANSFLSACCGTSTAPLIISGGATTAAQSNVTVTLAGGSLRFTSTAADAGKFIVWDGGQQARIVTVQTATTATATDSKTLSAGTFRYFQTTQTGLGVEIRRTTNFCAREGYCRNILAPPGQITLQRSWDFPDELTPAAYTEFGVSWDASAGNNLFSRIVSTSPVVIPTDFHLRLSYQLQMTLAPSAPSAKNLAVQGWPVSPATNIHGSECLEDWGLAGIAASGVTQAVRTSGGIPILANEPSTTCEILVSQNSTALSAPGQAPLNRWTATAFSKPALLDIYSPGTFQLTKTVRLAGGEGNMTGMRSISIGHQVALDDFLPVHTFLFDQGQSKSAPNLLRLSFKFNWARTFV